MDDYDTGLIKMVCDVPLVEMFKNRAMTVEKVIFDAKSDRYQRLR
jgi:hypothetical protein